MNYWYGPGAYNMNITFTDGAHGVSYEDTEICTYGLLTASAQTGLAVGFPNAAPGISNSPGNTQITMRNTGNGALNVTMTAYDLSGRSQPGVKLLASSFKVGASLGTAVTMADGVNNDLSMVIEPAQNAEDDILFWLSMPSSQVIQDYYSPTAWQVVT